MQKLGVSLVPEWNEPFFSDAHVILTLGGEGSGKSFAAGLFAACHAVYDAMVTDNKLYWVVGADFEDARKDFDYILEFMTQLGAVKEMNLPNRRDSQSQLFTTMGQQFVTISAYDPTKLGREEPVGIVGAEVSRWYEEAFQRCEDRLRRNYEHGWGFFTGSPETSLGWLPALWTFGQGPTGERRLRSYNVPTWANTYKYPGGRDHPAMKAAEASSSPQRFTERFGGRPTLPRNIIFSEFNPLLHIDKNLDYDPNLPVLLAIDPGDKVYCVLFVQLPENGEVRVVDEIYVQHFTHQQIINAAKSNEGWPLVQGGAIDIASTQNHMGLPMPMEEWYKDTGLALLASRIPVNDSIERVRVALSINMQTARPRLRIHPRCKGLISEMGGGPSPVPGGGPWMYSETRFGFGPPRAENDHACKALAYLLAGSYGLNAREYKVESASYLEKPLHV